jgi:gamma-glutamyl:cysteine ligase YbdK (ATP-grasp superfamily)
MTNQQHPVTPPPELVEQWQDESPETQIADHVQYLATQAAQWGADQELEACCKTLDRVNSSNYWSQVLRSDRRPRSPTLKEQAIAALNEIQDHMLGPTNQEKLIRRALEALDD